MSVWFPFNHNDLSDREFKSRLFCFPHSGGGASIFRKWQGYISPSCAVFPVQLPGRESRFSETPFTSMKDLLDALWPQILPLLDRPIAFFGHSLGALIAFEMVKKIERAECEQKMILFVSACASPQDLDFSTPLHTLPEEEFIERLKSYGAMPKQLLENKEILTLLVPRLRADFSILETYIPNTESIRAPIIAFEALDDELISHDQIIGWKHFTSNYFNLSSFPGGHFYYRQMIEPLSHQIDKNLDHFFNAHSYICT